jgi:hypothetical protein
VEHERDKSSGATGRRGVPATSHPGPLATIERVYVAASALEIDRAEQAIADLERRDIAVTSTWTINVRNVGASNPREASNYDRARWASTCLDEVRHSDLLWFLVPAMGAPTRGAWVELGYAIARGMTIVLSGDTRQSIFSALGVEMLADIEALELIARIADRAEVER